MLGGNQATFYSFETTVQVRDICSGEYYRIILATVTNQTAEDPPPVSSSDYILVKQSMKSLRPAFGLQDLQMNQPTYGSTKSVSSMVIRHNVLTLQQLTKTLAIILQEIL